MTTSKGALPVSYYTETPGEKKSLEDFLRIQDELEQALNNLLMTSTNKLSGHKG